MSQAIPDLNDCIAQTLNRYFATLDGQDAHDIYHMVLHQVEKPMFQCVMAQCGGNQSKAAQMLGLNRNTLRKKLAEHGLIT